MFNQLLESKAKKQKMAGGTAFSIVLHTVLIAAALGSRAFHELAFGVPEPHATIGRWRN